MEEGYYSDTKGCKCFVKIGVGWKDNRAIDFCPLHAAAPELLASCKEMVRDFDNMDWSKAKQREKQYQRAKLAIAKAEGGKIDGA